MPDQLLRAQLPQSAAREAAPDRKGQGDELAADERRQADERADGDAGIGPVDQAREERAFEGQIGGVVAEEESRHDARRQQDAEAEGEEQAIGPGPVLEDEDVPEPPEPRQHRRRSRHDRELDDECGQEHLLGGEKLLALHGFT